MDHQDLVPAPTLLSVDLRSSAESERWNVGRLVLFGREQCGISRLVERLELFGIFGRMGYLRLGRDGYQLCTFAERKQVQIVMAKDDGLN